MRFLMGAAVVAALTLSPVAAGESPPVSHFSSSDTFVNEDFCGTGESVTISFTVAGTVFLAPTQDADYRDTRHGVIYLTANGETIEIRFAGTFAFTMQRKFDPELGMITELVLVRVEVGLAQLVKLPNGPVVSLDAGFISFVNTYAFEDQVSPTVIVLDRGPHPGAENDPSDPIEHDFCGIVTSELGL